MGNNTIVKKYKRRGNGATYEVTFSKDTNKILRVVNLTKRYSNDVPMEIPLSTDTVKKYMIKQNFRSFVEV